LVSDIREDHRLKVFENKVLRKVFGTKRKKVGSVWKRPRNKEFHKLYSSPNIMRVIK